MNEYLEIAYQQALLANQEDEIPIGAVIVYNDKIIAKAHNQKEVLHDVSAHAELLAIQQASDYLGRWHLDDCVMYCTMEPCMMCTGAIVQSRIKTVYYGAASNRWDALSSLLVHHKYNHQLDFICLNDERCSSLIKYYFKKKRLNKEV